MRSACLLLRALTNAIGRGLAVSLLTVLAARAAEAPDTEAARVARERVAILAERERLEAQFAEEQARCAGRFAVTACLDGVRERRREALEGPRARALALDDAERQRRAAARREMLAQRQREAAERPPPAVSPAAPASAAAPALPPEAASTPRPAQGDAPPSARAMAASAGAEAAAAQRAAAARQRAAVVRAEQLRIEGRKDERARRGALSAPLPVPAASASR